MKNLTLFFVAIFWSLAATPASAQVPDSTILSLMEEFNVPGLSISVVTGDEMVNTAFGHADAAGRIPVTTDTPFRIASVAKVLVAATAMIEVADGSIALEDDLSALFPSSGPFSGPVTLHDLLTHSAGFDERLVGYAARSQEAMIPLADYLGSRMPARGWPVGEHINYSNHGMSLAALALQDASDESFADLATRKLFAPLDMTSTTFVSRDIPLPDSPAEPLRCNDAGCETVEHMFSHAYPAGLTFSTAPDMGRFVAAVLEANESGGPLSELIPTRFSHDERIPGMSYGFFNQEYAGWDVRAHAGSVPGYWSLLVVIPEKDMGFFFVANGGSSRFGERMRDELLTSLLGPWNAEKPYQLRSEDPEIRAGVYELTRYSHDTIERFPQIFYNSIQVWASGDTLLVYSGGRVREYLQTGVDLYQNVDGKDQIAFGMRRGEERMFRQSFAYGAGLAAAYEKRPFYRSPGFQNEYGSFLIGLPVIFVFAIWPIGALIALIRRRKKSLDRAENWKFQVAGSTVLAAATGLFVWFGFGFVAMSNRLLENGEMFFGVPEAMQSMTWMPVVHALLTVILIAVCVPVWRDKWWGLVRRLLFSVTVLGLILQLHFLINWNYLPASW